MRNTVKKKYLTSFWVFALLLIILHACEIPVFRYALERWAADKYRLVISKPAGGDFSETDKALIEKIRKVSGEAGIFNLELEINEKSELPAASMQLYFPDEVKAQGALWSGLLNEDNLKGVLESPARKELVKKILAGESVVWILVDGDEKLKSRLDEINSVVLPTLKLSDEIIQMDEVERINTLTTKKELDNVIRSTVPLKLSFSTITVKRDDPKEEVFLNMLLNQWPHLRYSDQQVAVPVFGRGRFLEAAPSDKIQKETVKKLADYLCSGCSCTVKSENPGVDLLIGVEWGKYVSESVMRVKEIPAVSGVAGDLEKSETVKDAEPEKAEKSTPFLYLLIAAGGLIFCVLVFSRIK